MIFPCIFIFKMNVKLSDITKTLLFHYCPAWIAWSGIYCIVFSSLNWNPRLTFTGLFIETQLQVLFVYLFMAGALYFFKLSNNLYRLSAIFFSMIIAVFCWEAGKFLIEKWMAPSVLQYPFSMGFILLRIFSGCFIIWCFLLAERYCLSELMLREEKIKGLMQENKFTNNEIRYLKSRIDPELLFKKLKSILELRDTDPDRAKSEQLDLVRYLRDSLAKTSSQKCADETAKI
jgi:hypothetical protein